MFEILFDLLRGTVERMLRGQSVATPPETSVEERHAKIETALLLDGRLAREHTEADLIVETSFPFSVSGAGAYGYPGPRAAQNGWGLDFATSFGYELDVADHECLQRAWTDMYAGACSRGRLVDAEPNGRAPRAFKLAELPVRVDGQWCGTGVPRTVARMKRKGTVHAMVPHSLMDDGTLSVLSLDARLTLLRCYALYDETVYGGVDPTHLRVCANKVCGSPELLSLYDGDLGRLCSAVAECEALGLLHRTPVPLERVRVFPAAPETWRRCARRGDGHGDAVFTMARAVRSAA